MELHITLDGATLAKHVIPIDKRIEPADVAEALGAEPAVKPAHLGRVQLRSEAPALPEHWTPEHKRLITERRERPSCLPSERLIELLESAERRLLAELRRVEDNLKGHVVEKQRLHDMLDEAGVMTWSVPLLQDRLRVLIAEYKELTRRDEHACINNLREENAGLKARIASLEQEAQRAHADAKAALSNADALRADNEHLRRDNEALRALNSDLELNNNAHKRHIRALSNEKDQLRTENVQMAEQLKTATRGSIVTHVINMAARVAYGMQSPDAVPDALTDAERSAWTEFQRSVRAKQEQYERVGRQADEFGNKLAAIRRTLS